MFSERAYSLAQLVSGFGTPAVLILLVWKGRTPERVAAAAFAAVEYGTPLLDRFVDDSMRPGVAFLSFSLLVVLTGLALKVDRWWLLAAAGFQLLAVSTWVLAAFNAASIWPGVTVRLFVWWLLMAAALIGVWESRKAPYALPKPAKAGRIIS